MATTPLFTLFTKPWRELPLQRLIEHVAELGYDGVELPVRPGYQVPPEEVAVELPKAARAFEQAGVRIVSVAGPADPATIRACGEAGVPILRTMAAIATGESYTAAEDRQRREYDALLPALRAASVILGVQNHCDRFVANALGLDRLLAPYDPQLVAAVWDAAHEALNGGLPGYALDVIWPRLCLVNLKNAFWQRSNGPESGVAAWRHYWTDGPNGLANWPGVVSELRQRGYRGPVCLTAEYSDEALVDVLAARDLAWARALFVGEE
jgi:sugar phosphate isomerase/epimerase